MHCCLPSNSLRYFFFLFFCQDLVRAISLELLLAETPNWVCCLFLRSNFALLLTIQFALLFFFSFFHHDFVRAISLEPLLAETPNWVCCLVLRSNFALLLTIQFASLISSLINIISLLLTTFDWTKVRGSLLGRTQGDRELVSLLLTIPVGDAIWDCRRSFFSLFFSFLFFPPRFCPAHISGTVTHRDSKLSVLLGPAV